MISKQQSQFTITIKDTGCKTFGFFLFLEWLVTFTCRERAGTSTNRKDSSTVSCACRRFWRGSTSFNFTIKCSLYLVDFQYWISSLFWKYHGKAALHLAAENGHEQVADVLLWHKAFVNAKSKLGLTPLHLAAQNGYNDLVRLLIETHNAVIDALSLVRRYQWI